MTACPTCKRETYCADCDICQVCSKPFVCATTCKHNKGFSPLDQYLKSDQWDKLKDTISELALKCPSFDGDLVLAENLGKLMANLDTCLQEYWKEKHGN